MKQETAEHYISSVLALNHATHSALLCVPIKFRHQLKQAMNDAINANRRFESLVKNEWLKGKPEVVEQYENISAFYSEVLTAIAKTDNRVELLSLIKAYNDGEVKIEE